MQEDLLAFSAGPPPPPATLTSVNVASAALPSASAQPSRGSASSSLVAHPPVASTTSATASSNSNGPTRPLWSCPGTIQVSNPAAIIPGERAADELLGALPKTSDVFRNLRFLRRLPCFNEESFLRGSITSAFFLRRKPEGTLEIVLVAVARRFWNYTINVVVPNTPDELRHGVMVLNYFS